MAASALIPGTASARAQAGKRLSFAFGPRFFIALLLGFVWIVPTWWSPQLIAGMFLWDVLLIAAWVVDFRRLPAPADIQVRRIWDTPLSIAAEATVTIEVENAGTTAVRMTCIDATPAGLADAPPEVALDVPPASSARAAYRVLPRERGDARMGRTFLRYRTAVGIAERWAVADLTQVVRVLPDLAQARNQALYLIRSRQVEMEKRRTRQKGAGREFGALREYRQGDEMRDICWPATARRHQLITRTYEVERSQAVWIVLDAGRLLRAQVVDPSRPFRSAKLDYAVDAALSLAHVASQSGDRVGLLAYGRTIQQSISVGRGPLHLRAILDALAQVRAEASEADHARAVKGLLRAQTRRALIVWISDFAETATTPEVIEYAMRMTDRHLVVLAAMSQPDLVALAKGIPQNEEEMFRQTAALEIVERREQMLRGLRQRGVLAVDLAPGGLAGALVNQYLEIKDRSLL